MVAENTLGGIGALSADQLFAAMGYFACIDSDAARACADRVAATFGADGAQRNGFDQTVKSHRATLITRRICRASCQAIP